MINIVQFQLVQTSKGPLLYLLTSDNKLYVGKGVVDKDGMPTPEGTPHTWRAVLGGTINLT